MLYIDFSSCGIVLWVWLMIDPTEASLSPNFIQRHCKDDWCPDCFVVTILNVEIDSHRAGCIDSMICGVRGW